MAPIRSYLDEDAAFDADTTQAMGRTFEAACSALGIVTDDVCSRRVVAARIIDLARAGMTPRALRDRIVIESKAKL